MKNLLKYLAIGLLAITVSCSSDDAEDLVGDIVSDIENLEVEVPEVEVPEVEVPEVVSPRTSVVFNEVSYATDVDWIEVYNPTGETIDISDYWLCLGPGTYSQISTLTVNGNMMLGSGDFAVISGYSLPNQLLQMKLIQLSLMAEVSELIFGQKLFRLHLV